MGTFHNEWLNKNNLELLWAAIKLNFIHAAPCAKGSLLYWDQLSETTSPKQPATLNVATSEVAKRVLGIENGLPKWRVLNAKFTLGYSNTIPQLTINVYGQATTITLPLADPTRAGLVGVGAQTFAGIKTFQDGIILGSKGSKKPLKAYNSNSAGDGTVRHILGYDTNTDDFLVGYEIPEDGGKTRIFGNSIEFMHGPTKKVGMVYSQAGVLSVINNIESTGGGVSAVGIGDLAATSGGGSFGTVTSIKLGSNESLYEPDQFGVIQIPDYFTKDEVNTTFAAKSEILPLISTGTSESNPLTNKSYVDTQVSTSTATFRGTSAPNLTEAQFLSWVNSRPNFDLNDYVFWNTKDSLGNVVFKRYKYNGASWEFEYDLNNSSFDSSQWGAINSGITETLRKRIYSGSLNNGDLVYYKNLGGSNISPVTLGISSGSKFLSNKTGLPTWEAFSTPVLEWAAQDNISKGPKLRVKVQEIYSGWKDIPVASNSTSGVVNMDAQTFKGLKTFTDGLVLGQQKPLKTTNYNNTTTYDVITQAEGNVLKFGHGTSQAGFNTQLYGKDLLIYTNLGHRATFTNSGLSVLGGVSASGIDSLSVSGTGGSGSVIGVKLGKGDVYESDQFGVVSLPAYPDVSGFVTQTVADGKYQLLSNKSSSITSDSYSEIKYPSVKAVWNFSNIQHAKSGEQPSDPTDIHVVSIGANKLYLKFNAASQGTFHIEVADAVSGGNRQQFTFGTVSEADINSICVL